MTRARGYCTDTKPLTWDEIISLTMLQYTGLQQPRHSRELSSQSHHLSHWLASESISVSRFHKQTPKRHRDSKQISLRKDESLIGKEKTILY